MIRYIITANLISTQMNIFYGFIKWDLDRKNRVSKQDRRNLVRNLRSKRIQAVGNGVMIESSSTLN